MRELVMMMISIQYYVVLPDFFFQRFIAEIFFLNHASNSLKSQCVINR